jgi:hypothetical protein
VRAREFAGAKRHGGEKVLTRPGEGGDGGELLVYRPERQAGAWLEFPVEVEAKEPLRLAVSGARFPEGGRYQAFLNGVKVGRPLDFHAEERGAREFPLLDFWPDPGAYVLRLECIGRDPGSAGYACAIDSVRLLERRPRVARYGHDKDKDWRKNPILYE